MQIDVYLTWSIYLAMVPVRPTDLTSKVCRDAPARLQVCFKVTIKINYN